MTDNPSSILLTREQSTGSNVNLWGGYLITTQRITEQAMKGYQSLAVTADATISWTNYTTGNTGQCARLKLTGSLTSAAALTFPSLQNFMSVENKSGAAVTIKCSGGTGVSIGNAQTATLYCNGTDYFNAAPLIFPTGNATFAGQVKGVSTGTADTDAVNKLQMETAIATAGIPASAGTVFVNLADTTPNYLTNKLTVSGSLVKSITNPGGNEAVNIDFTFDEGQGALYAGVMAL